MHRDFLEVPGLMTAAECARWVAATDAACAGDGATDVLREYSFVERHEFPLEDDVRCAEGSAAILAHVPDAQAPAAPT